MSVLDPERGVVRAVLMRLGYRIERIPDTERSIVLGHDVTTPLPALADTDLRPDHPRLLELERRYEAFDSPTCSHTQWRSELENDGESLLYFRGENAYLWQYVQKLDGQRHSYEDMRSKYYVYARYVRELDHHGLLGRTLTEDGLFGCFTFRFQEMPTVSRDLLDSVNELYFLDRHWDLFRRSGVRVLDIGAGYGRLAHRMLASVPGVERYLCIDAIPRSTFLSEYYLRYRGLLGGSDARAVVVPLDDMGSAPPPGAIDLAVNIHSFSEMSYAAVEAWVLWLAELEVPWLMIIPNEPEMMSRELDGSRLGYLSLLERAGYKVVAREPTIRDVDTRELFGMSGDEFFLFQRA